MSIPDGLLALVEDGVIDQVLRPLKSGKEADMWIVSKDDVDLAAKVYKERDKRNFKNRAGYQEGRVVRNSRSQRALDKGTRFGKGLEDTAWRDAEVEALRKLSIAGARVPQVFAYEHGVLVMELVVDAEGRPAPQLAQLSPTPEEALVLWDQLLTQVVIMLKSDFVHGDLSPYNVLVGEHGPVIIDLPQVIGAAANLQAGQILERDVQSLSRFLGLYHPQIRRAGRQAWQLWREYERGTLTEEFRPDVPAEDAPAAVGPEIDDKVIREIHRASAEAKAERDAKDAREGIGVEPPKKKLFVFNVPGPRRGPPKGKGGAPQQGGRGPGGRGPNQPVHAGPGPNGAAPTNGAPPPVGGPVDPLPAAQPAARVPNPDDGPVDPLPPPGQPQQRQGGRGDGRGQHPQGQRRDGGRGDGRGDGRGGGRGRGGRGDGRGGQGHGGGERPSFDRGRDPRSTRGDAPASTSGAHPSFDRAADARGASGAHPHFERPHGETPSGDSLPTFSGHNDRPPQDGPPRGDGRQGGHGGGPRHDGRGPRHDGRGGGYRNDGRGPGGPRHDDRPRDDRGPGGPDGPRHDDHPRDDRGPDGPRHDDRPRDDRPPAGPYEDGPPDDGPTDDGPTDDGPRDDGPREGGGPGGPGGGGGGGGRRRRRRRGPRGGGGGHGGGGGGHGGGGGGHGGGGHRGGGGHGGGGGGYRGGGGGGGGYRGGGGGGGGYRGGGGGHGGHGGGPRGPGPAPGP